MSRRGLTRQQPGSPHPDGAIEEILGSLLLQHDLRAGLVTDAILAAICIEHGLTMISADSDSARFTQVRWVIR